MRRAKIVCTLGPATSSTERIRELVDAGMDVARLNLSHGTYAEHEEIYRRVREASDETGHGVGHLRRPPGAQDPARQVQGGLVAAADRGRRSRSRPVRWPGNNEIASTTYEGLPGDVAARRPDPDRRRQGAPAGDRGRRHRRAHPGRRRRPRQRPQGHQPARRTRVRPGDVGEGHRGPPLGAAPHRRLHRAVVRALGRGRRGRAQDHEGGGRLPARDRQDREAAGDRQPQRDREGLRRLHGGPRRPRRGVPARGRAVPAEARGREGPTQRQARHRGHPDARVDDQQPGARRGPRPPTSPTRCSTAPTR